jgi:hypothetical protein
MRQPQAGDIHEMTDIPHDTARCDGVQHDGHWREGCEHCLRRTAPRPAKCVMMTPPPIIAFWCEFLIEP